MSESMCHRVYYRVLPTQILYSVSVFIQQSPSNDTSVIPVRLEGAIAANRMARSGGADLCSYVTHSIFREYLAPDEFRTRLVEKHGIDSADEICFLFDELQAVQDYPETAGLLDWLATSAIAYVGVGTFKLKALDWSVPLQ